VTAFKDVGRMVLEAVITARLGDGAEKHDVPALVDEYVKQFGFKDLDEVNDADFENLAWKYLRN
jgi:PHP family Zn ribbon phosphoesterase